MRLKINAAVWALLFLVSITCQGRAGISVVGGLTHERSVKPGESRQGIVLIRNSSDEPGEVKIYQKDYLFFSDGKNIYGDPGKDPRSNADWISFSPKRLTIPPGETSRVNYTIKVPEDETAAGTYWSIFMVEGIPKDSPEAAGQEKGKIKVGITTVLRYGIQMVTHIGDTGIRKLKFPDTKLLKEKNEAILQVDLENIGERYLRPSLWTELYDEEGNYIGRFEGGRLRIYPGTSVRYRIDLARVPKGKYKALVVADCGGDDVFGATYTLELGE